MQIPAVANHKQRAELQPQLDMRSLPEGAKKRAGNKPMSAEEDSLSRVVGESSKDGAPESTSSLNPAQLLR